MSKNHHNLIYAFKNGHPIHISEVESGLKCECVCPACGELLVAKKGNKRTHHFSHYNGHNCEYGYETSLHLAAKEIISKLRKIIIPSVFVEFPDSYKEKQLISPAKEIVVDDVKLEKRYGDVIPDIVLVSGEKELFVEIYVTHKIDEYKLEKLKKANISTIEINLSKKENTVTKEELSQILLGDNEFKTWKYNALAQKYLQRYYTVADRRDTISRGFALQVDNCPIKVRMWRGKPYANYIDDCLYCEYCISAKGDNGLLCSGRLRISTLQDFNISEEKRIKDSNDQIDVKKESAFMAGKCPNCGWPLIERQGKYGSFIGCSNYPYCRFMAVIDSDTGEIKIKA